LSSKYNKYNQLLRENKDIEIISETNYRCNSCAENYNCKSKNFTANIKIHVKTKKHKLNIELKESTNIDESDNQFYIDLAKAFIEANIPLNKLNHPSFRNFLQKYLRIVCPDESTIRKMWIKPLYDETTKK